MLKQPGMHSSPPTASFGCPSALFHPPTHLHLMLQQPFYPSDSFSPPHLCLTWPNSIQVAWHTRGMNRSVAVDARKRHPLSLEFHYFITTSTIFFQHPLKVTITSPLPLKCLWVCFPFWTCCRLSRCPNLQNFVSEGGKHYVIEIFAM